MNVIIPLGGVGRRFAECGFTDPKPFISVRGRCILHHVLGSMCLEADDCCVLACSSALASDERLAAIVAAVPFRCHILTMEGPTQGAADTVRIVLDMLVTARERGIPFMFDRVTMVCDGDTFYTEDVVGLVRASGARNTVLVAHRPSALPLFSFVELVPGTDTLVRIVEKEAISTLAATGVYVFRSATTLHEAVVSVINTGTRVRGEFYMSSAVQAVIDGLVGMDAGAVHATFIDDATVVSLGTPVEVDAFVGRTPVFLCDLDGTLVRTEAVYTRVWQELMAPFGIPVDGKVFATRISGFADSHVAATVLTGHDVDVRALSQRKDMLFVQHVAEAVACPGALAFLRRAARAGVPVVIVSNCNRAAAEAVLGHLGMRRFVTGIVCADDGHRPKPFPDPYRAALALLGDTPPWQAHVFEDAPIGMHAAAGLVPRRLVAVVGTHSATELQGHCATDVVSSLEDVDEDLFCLTPSDFGSRSLGALGNAIFRALHPQPASVLVWRSMCKGGFIADVCRVSVLWLPTANVRSEYVFKIESAEPSALKSMASSLHLYDRELFFYEKVQEVVSAASLVDSPKCIAIVSVEFADGAKRGVVLENVLARDTGKFVSKVHMTSACVEAEMAMVRGMARLHCTPRHLWQHLEPEMMRADDRRVGSHCAAFLRENWAAFEARWHEVLTPAQMALGAEAVRCFPDTQTRLSSGELVLLHGDVKAPNTFFDTEHGHAPCFFDWQYLGLGKGVQDVVFFCIESFSESSLLTELPAVIAAYNAELVALGATETTHSDFVDALRYFPLFVAVWFGTCAEDALPDPGFPIRFIPKYFACLEKFARE